MSDEKVELIVEPVVEKPKKKADVMTPEQIESRYQAFLKKTRGGK